MRIRKTAGRNIHPVVAAIAIAVVLGVVQYVWWMKLVYKKRGSPGGGGGGSPSRAVAPVPQAYGMKDVTVSTLAGSPEPGDADGPGHTAHFDGPSALALDASGNVYVADTRNNRIRMITSIGHTSTVAGGEAGFKDGPVRDALFDHPSGIAVAKDGTIFVADTGNHRIRSIRDGVVYTDAGSTAGFADGEHLTKARFNLPTALSLETLSTGGQVLIIADSGNKKVRRMPLLPASYAGASRPVSTVSSQGGAVTSVAAGPGTIAAAVPDAGRLTIGTTSLTQIPIATGGGGTGGGAGALTVSRPGAVCRGGSEWYVSDPSHGAVLQVTPGSATVIAGICQGGGPIFGFRDGSGDWAMFGAISALASDGKGHIFVADGTNNAIRRITLPTSGTIDTSFNGGNASERRVR